MLLCFIASCNMANACYVMPENLVRPARELVQQANEILWVQVVGALPQMQPDIGDGGINVRFVLDVVEVLKGVKSKKQIVINGSVDGVNFISSTRNNHKDFQFKYGSSGVNANCTRAMPSLVLGAHYLIFIGGQPDTKDFERVESSEDEWLQLVRTEIKVLRN